MHERFFELYKLRIKNYFRQHGEYIYSDCIPLEAELGQSLVPVPYKERLSLKYRPVQEGDTWGPKWSSAWLHVQATVPARFAGKELCLRINGGGEALVYDKKGVPAMGLTNVCAFEQNYHKDRYLIGKCKTGAKLDYWIELAANALFGIQQPQAFDRNPDDPLGTYIAQISQLKLCVFERELWGLHHDMKALYGQIEFWGDNDYRSKQLLTILNNALDIFQYDNANVPAVRKYLAEKAFSRKAYASAPTVCSIGHAHIDLGWLWPVRETTRKAARTFASQLDNMERYPDYKFGESQAYLYKIIKENYPELYAKIKKRVKEGRWELQGGMYVEADNNIISGESMVRQFLHGKNFFMDEFGVDVKNLWIPDVFGYSASCPQFIRKSGCDYFLTQKISWSQFNHFPHNTFRWIGVDGTEVLTHFPPEDTYNSDGSTLLRMKSQNQFPEIDILPEYMSLVGIGDGGGGPTDDYLERCARTTDLEGCPKNIFRFASDFFEDIKQYAPKLPAWKGELYLELHRGTLTTQAHTKRNNRKCEQALTALEFLASCLPAEEYPSAELDNAWKTVLLNQFHDIIPGSSIHLVYQQTEQEHTNILSWCNQTMGRLARKLFSKAKGAAVLVNTLSYPWSGVIELPWQDSGANDETGAPLPVQAESGRLFALVEVPASSFATIRKTAKQPSAAKQTRSRVLENDLIRYEFDAQGRLTRAFDKQEQREVLAAPANVLSLYNDRPCNYEAWDVDIYYQRECIGSPACAMAGTVVQGPARSTLSFQYKTEKSTIEQTVVLRQDSRRLDFVTHVDWHEHRIMLRVAFPVAISSDKASYDIQYAYTERPTHDNTSWDEAKFECCGQRYADLSQGDYGAALLNDCKYGYRVKGNTLDLNLLRSPKHPDYLADMGTHEFTYSFLPHPGPLVGSDVMQEAALLNREPFVANGMAAGKALPPCCLESEGATLEVVKKAEKDNSTILRIVENRGRATDAVLFLRNPTAKVTETNLIEWEHGKAYPVKDGRVLLSLKPFEILTLRLQ
ncbi:MAG: alpha-mannosidase [Victivallales bacterium]|nr:alpha-mannosidase [Victivallales bacterium]